LHRSSVLHGLPLNVYARAFDWTRSTTCGAGRTR
jgi:hypothetical protein